MSIWFSYIRVHKLTFEEIYDLPVLLLDKFN